MDRVLKNRGCACGSTRILAFRPFSVPSPPWKIASWLLSTLLTTHACNCDHESINHPKTKIFQIAFFYVDEKRFLSWWNGYFPFFDQRYRCSIMIVETCLIAKNSFLIKSVFWLLHCFHVTYPYYANLYVTSQSPDSYTANNLHSGISADVATPSYLCW